MGFVCASQMRYTIKGEAKRVIMNATKQRPVLRVGSFKELNQNKVGHKNVQIYRNETTNAFSTTTETTE